MDLSLERLKLSDDDGGGDDRLSALPDDLLIHILVLVKDAAEAARTSILASRWRRLWALLPELRFVLIEHHGIGAALAAHEVSDLSFLFALTKDSSPESASAWLSTAAVRGFAGRMYLEVVRPKAQTEAEERGAAIDLPCFEKASIIILKLGFLGLALPPSGVFARLNMLCLVDIQLHGQSSGLGNLLSSQRCPSLQCLRVRNVRGLDSFNIQSDSLLEMELSHLHRLQQLTVIAPALEKLTVRGCFTDNPDLCAANISAPHLTFFRWMNVDDPSSIQLDDMAHLEWLAIQLYILEGEEEASEHQYGMMLLRRFEHIHTLDLNISYPQDDICTGPYLLAHMPRLPCVSSLALGIVAYGHSFGASSFVVLRRCTGVKNLALDFMPEIQLEEQTLCPSGCTCDQTPNWRTDELALNCLEDIRIHGMRTEDEVILVQRLLHWATIVKRVKIFFHESITESKDKELRQLLLSFSRPGISMDFGTFVR